MSLFLQMDLSHFYSQSEWIQGILRWQLLQQFYAELFKTLHEFSSLSEDVPIVWI